MLSTTLRDKLKDFTTLDEYLDFRIIDTGAPYVLSSPCRLVTVRTDQRIASSNLSCYLVWA